MKGPGKSDRPVVPWKPPNKGDGASSLAEGVEGRGLAKENLLRPTQSIGRRAAPDWPSALERLRPAARKDRDARFTALWHHVATVHRLREESFSLKHDSGPGVDGQTWRQYGETLEANLQDLAGRLHRGAYHAKPVRRAWIPKADGRQRPIGIPTLEDKIVQAGPAPPEDPTDRVRPLCGGAKVSPGPGQATDVPVPGLPAQLQPGWARAVHGASAADTPAGPTETPRSEGRASQTPSRAGRGGWTMAASRAPGTLPLLRSPAHGARVGGVPAQDRVAMAPGVVSSQPEGPCALGAHGPLG